MVREIEIKGDQKASGSGHQQTEPVPDGWSAWLGPVAGAAAFTGVPVGGSVAPREPYPGHSEGKPYRPTTDQDFFWKPEPVRRMHSSPQPDNCGVGLILGVHSETGTVLVQGMMPGSAAARSGLLKIDDVIAEVDGINVSSCRLPIDVVESLIHGRQGTALRLVVVRAEMKQVMKESWEDDTRSSTSSVSNSPSRRTAFNDNSDEAGDTREIALSLLREVGSSTDRDIVRPKRMGVGITFEVQAVDNAVTVKKCVRGSPACKSGLIQNGDILFEIDGTNVYRESLEVVSLLLLGEPGTKVRLLFLRGTRIFIEATLERMSLYEQSDMAEILRFAQAQRPLTMAGKMP